MSDSSPAGTRLPMKVLFIHCASDLYGVSRVVLRTATQLDRRAFTPHVILPKEGPLAEALRHRGVPTTIMKSLSVVNRQVYSSWRLFQFLLMIPVSALVLWWFMKRENIAVVHTHTGQLVSAGFAARLAGVPNVWHVHDSFHEFPKAWAVYRAYIRWASHKIICVSGSIARQFGGEGGKVRIIHVGIPIEELQSVSQEEVGEFKTRYGLRNERLVGVVGRVKFQRKGQDVFVKAIGYLKGRVDNVKYLIVGSPSPGNESHLENLRKLIRELGVEDVVILTGDVERTAVVYHALDILVLPSCFPEPFGAVVLEAMAAGTPVIGTNLGGTLEQIEDGRSGVLIEPNNPGTLAATIERLLSDGPLCRRIGEAGRRRVQENFAFERELAEVEEIYRAALAV